MPQNWSTLPAARHSETHFDEIERQILRGLAHILVEVFVKPFKHEGQVSIGVNDVLQPVETKNVATAQGRARTVQRGAEWHSYKSMGINDKLNY